MQETNWKFVLAFRFMNLRWRKKLLYFPCLIRSFKSSETCVNVTRTLMRPQTGSLSIAKESLPAVRLLICDLRILAPVTVELRNEATKSEVLILLGFKKRSRITLTFPFRLQWRRWCFSPELWKGKDSFSIVVPIPDRLLDTNTPELEFTNSFAIVTIFHCSCSVQRKNRRFELQMSVLRLNAR